MTVMRQAVRIVVQHQLAKAEDAVQGAAPGAIWQPHRLDGMVQASGFAQRAAGTPDQLGEIQQPGLCKYSAQLSVVQGGNLDQHDVTGKGVHDKSCAVRQYSEVELWQDNWRLVEPQKPAPKTHAGSLHYDILNTEDRAAAVVAADLAAAELVDIAIEMGVGTVVG